jgi:hypothetical protein
LRTDVAHTGVSTLGKIFKITLWPFKSDNLSSDKSVLVTANSGQARPILGKSPTVWIGLPLKVIDAMFISWLGNILLCRGFVYIATTSFCD